MLISARELKDTWNVTPDTVLHVGGHNAEELADYEELGWGKNWTVWVEALPSACEEIRSRTLSLPHHHVVQALAWDSVEDRSFNVASNGESSSVFEFGTHRDHHPDIYVHSVIQLRTATLERILSDANLQSPEFINLDVQGAELHVLRGLGSMINSVRFIYAEVSWEQVYLDAPRQYALEAWLRQRGFQRIDIQHTKAGWGDALFCRVDSLPRMRVIRRGMRRVRRRLSGLLRSG